MNLQFFAVYLNRFSGEVLPIVPFLPVFYAESGLGLAEVSLVFFVLSISVVLFELPSGVFADRFSVRKVLIIGRAIRLAAFLILFLFNNLWGFILAAVFWGLAIALDSGAFQSYLYRLVREKSSSNNFDKVLSRSFSASLFGLLLASIIATQVSWLSFASLQIVGLMFLVISFISTLFLPKIELAENLETEGNYFWKELKQGFNFVLTTPWLLYLLLVGVLAGAVKGSLDEYTSLLLVEQNLSLAFVGYVLFGLEVLKTSGAFLAQWFKVRERNQALMLIIFGSCFWIIGFTNSAVISVVVLSLVIVFDAVLWVHNDVAIQHQVSDKDRAKVTSFKNFATEILAAFIFLIMWLLGEGVSLGWLYMALGGFLVLFAFSLRFRFIKEGS